MCLLIHFCNKKTVAYSQTVKKLISLTSDFAYFIFIVLLMSYKSYLWVYDICESNSAKINKQMIKSKNQQ